MSLPEERTYTFFNASCSISHREQYRNSWGFIQFLEVFDSLFIPINCHRVRSKVKWLPIVGQSARVDCI